MAKHLTDEHKRKLSIAHKGKPSAFQGRTHSPKTRAKMSKSIKRAYEEGRLIPWSKGKKLSAEIRKHMSEGQKKYYETHDSHLKGKKQDKVIVEKQRISRLQYYENNKVWNLGIKHTESTRAKISKGMFEYWSRRKNGTKSGN